MNAQLNKLPKPLTSYEKGKTKQRELKSTVKSLYWYWSDSKNNKNLSERKRVEYLLDLKSRTFKSGEQFGYKVLGFDALKQANLPLKYLSARHLFFKGIGKEGKVKFLQPVENNGFDAYARFTQLAWVLTRIERNIICLITNREKLNAYSKFLSIKKIVEKKYLESEKVMGKLIEAFLVHVASKKSDKLSRLFTEWKKFDRKNMHVLREWIIARVTREQFSDFCKSHKEWLELECLLKRQRLSSTKQSRRITNINKYLTNYSKENQKLGLSFIEAFLKKEDHSRSTIALFETLGSSQFNEAKRIADTEFKFDGRRCKHGKEYRCSHTKKYSKNKKKKHCKKLGELLFETGRSDLIKQLFSKLSDTHEKYNEKLCTNWVNDSAKILIDKKRLDILTYLVEQGLDLNRNGPSSTWRNLTIIEYALFHKHEKSFIKSLIELGYRPNARKYYGELQNVLSHGIDFCIRLGYLEAMKMMLNRGAVPDSYAMEEACDTGDLEIVKLLLGTGVDVNKLKNLSRTFLGYLIDSNKQEYFSSIKHLIENDYVDVNALDEKENTPLMMAISTGDRLYKDRIFDIIKMLIKKGADMNILVGLGHREEKFANSTVHYKRRTIIEYMKRLHKSARSEYNRDRRKKNKKDRKEAKEKYQKAKEIYKYIKKHHKLQKNNKKS